MTLAALTLADYAVLATFGIIAGYVSAVFSEAIRSRRRRRRWSRRP